MFTAFARCLLPGREIGVSGSDGQGIFPDSSNLGSALLKEGSDWELRRVWFEDCTNLTRVRQRSQSLDVLRGIAVLLVLLCHYSPLLSFGGFGVDLFFVLSGFLISGLLFQEFKATGTINVWRFWVRRGLKIYPPFYAFLLLTSLVLWFITGGVPHEVVADIFFVQNYFPHLWMHGWSLAVEEHFYIALPLLLLLLLAIGRRSPNAFRLIPILSIALSVLCVYLRALAAHHARTWDEMFAPTHLRMDSLFAGVTLGYYAHFDAESFAEGRRKLVLVLGLLLVLPAFLFPGTVVGVTVAYVAFACIVAWAANQPYSANRLLRSLEWVGYYSYSIYLWHGAAQVFFDVVLRSVPHVVRFPLFIFSTILVGVGMAKLVEVPAIKLRNRLFPSLTSTSIPSTRTLSPPIRSSLNPTLVIEAAPAQD